MVKFIGHAGTADTLVACQQADGYVRGNWEAIKPLPLGRY